MNDFLNLLLDFQNLPIEERSKTFMEVSGQAHYENVASNILAFYFDPNEEHGLQNLLLTAFFEMAGYKDLVVTELDYLEREFATDERKRLDLVIAGRDFVIGIENKIYHWEANDFEHYSCVIDALGSGKAIKIKAVLGLHVNKTSPALPGGFRRFTYTELWAIVCSKMGPLIPKANPKWVTYLIEFMETTERLAGISEPNKEFTEFYIKHNRTIELLLSERQALINRLDDCNKVLERNLKNELEQNEYITKVWIFERNFFVIDFVIEGHSIALDLLHEAVDWKLIIYDRGDVSQEYLRKLLSTNAFSQKASRERGFLLQTWDIHATQIELQDAVKEWVDHIINAANEIRKF